MTAGASYDDWHRVIGTTAEEDASSLRHEAVHPYLGLLRHGRVLEIGCGRGAFALEASGHGPELLGAYDYSPAAVEVARRRCNGPVFADIQYLPFRPGSFEAVVSLETIEHVPEPERAIAELVAALTGGGTCS